MNVNLRGPVMCTQAFLPRLLEQGGGRIINISSYLAEVLMPGMMSYSVSKIALEKLTQALAAELQPKSIAVNALRIEMWIATEGTQYLNPGIDYSNWEKPGAASEATLWLATRDPSYTGQVVTIAEVREQMTAGGG
jgi:NAD(P)-dependent dehydrogenase (short-subunit alcohol dehydrogenase family)